MNDGVDYPMPMESHKSTVVVAGLGVNVFSDTPLSPSGRPVAILFLLHGRTGSASMLDRLAETVLSYTREHGATGRDLVIVTFDHRNHGSRLVNSTANDDWTLKNERHAIDMYAIQTGTASDVSFLIDFLPAYLFPSGGREIEEWMLAGISLGGHSTWIALKNDSRIRIGIPIIGCPSYLELMRPRAEASSLSVSPPHFPTSLLEAIQRHDPSSAEISSSEMLRNPFLGKSILVLSGGKDPLVPWSASKKFVEELQVGNGTKAVVVDENAGHECSPRMVQELSKFVWEHGINSPLQASY